MIKIPYYILTFFIWCFSRLPLKVLFIISDLLYPIVYYIVRYRKQVVRDNLKLAFPEKNVEEIIAIEKKFYRHFIDLIVETVKLTSITKQEVPKYIRIKNPEYLDELYQKKISAIGCMGHYGNWEWLSMIQAYSTGYQNLSLYKPLHNKAFDLHITKIRTKHGVIMVPMHNALRQILSLRNDGIITNSCFIADQSPFVKSIHYCTLFFDQPTAVFTGIEKIARHTKQAVIFLTINKIRRGFYEVVFSEIALNANDFKEYEITEKFTKMLEDQIRREPQYWLWTHKRWKHSQLIIENADNYQLSDSLKAKMKKSS